MHLERTMTIRTHAAKRLMATSAAALALAWSHPVAAHCDTLDGPVVGAARRALETGNVDLVLVWVQKDDEAEVLGHFQKTLAVRKLSPQARRGRLHGIPDVRAGAPNFGSAAGPVPLRLQPGLAVSAILLTFKRT
jgi:hypothetical protein